MALLTASRCRARSTPARFLAQWLRRSPRTLEQVVEAWVASVCLRARAQIGSVRAQSACATALAWVHLPPAGTLPHPKPLRPAGSLAAAAAAVTAEPLDCSPDTLLLAVGGADGAVRLLGGLVGELAAMPPRLWYKEGVACTSEAAHRDGGGAPAMALLAQPLPADYQSIVCLDAAVGASPTGAPRLVLAAGKASGALAAWSSGELGAAAGSGAGSGLGSAAAALAGGTAACAEGAHDSLRVTGVRMAADDAAGGPTGECAAQAPQRGGAAAGLCAHVVSTGEDSAVRCWRLAGAQLLPEPALPGLAGEHAGARGPFSGSALRVVTKGGAAKPCMGVAVAAAGAAAAVVHHTVNVGLEQTAAMQVHMKLLRGRLRLLAGPALAPACDAPALGASARRAVARLAAGPPTAQANPELRD